MAHKNVRGVRTATHKAKKAKEQEMKEMAFKEVFSNPPSTVKKQSKEKMRKQMIAIALSKAKRGKS